MGLVRITAHPGDILVVAVLADAHVRRDQLHILGNFNLSSESTLFSVLGGM